MGHTMTTTAHPARRARLKLVISEEAETAHIERILHTRLRERRERRVALERRQAHSAEEERWTDIAGALEIEGTDDPRRLLAEIKNGLPCCFWNAGRWWQRRPVTRAVRDTADIQGNRLIDRHCAGFENEPWAFRISVRHWREHLCKPAASVPSTERNPDGVSQTARPLPCADEDTIRNAIKDDYEKRKEAGEKALNVNEIITPIKRRLERMGFYAEERRSAKSPTARNSRSCASVRGRHGQISEKVSG
jgi:hypothetical protein